MSALAATTKRFTTTFGFWTSTPYILPTWHEMYIKIAHDIDGQQVGPWANSQLQLGLEEKMEGRKDVQWDKVYVCDTQYLMTDIIRSGGDFIERFQASTEADKAHVATFDYQQALQGDLTKHIQGLIAPGDLSISITVAGTAMCRAVGEPARKPLFCAFGLAVTV